jgi:hypothetical protein
MPREDSAPIIHYHGWISEIPNVCCQLEELAEFLFLVVGYVNTVFDAIGKV